MSFVYDKELVNAFVGERCGGESAPGHYGALGWEKNGRLVAGMTLYNYNGKNAYVSIAIDNGIFPRELLKAGLWYAFGQLHLRRLTFVNEQANLRAQTLNKRLGARLEATLRDAGTSGDLLIYSLFPEDCLIWKRLQNGQRKLAGGTGP